MLFGVKTTIKVDVKQAHVEELIKRELEAEYPNIVINEITFTSARKGGDAIRIDVDADFEGNAPTQEELPFETETVEEPVQEKEDPSSYAEEQEEEATEESVAKKPLFSLNN